MYIEYCERLNIIDGQNAILIDKYYWTFCIRQLDNWYFCPVSEVIIRFCCQLTFYFASSLRLFVAIDFHFFYLSVYLNWNSFSCSQNLYCHCLQMPPKKIEIYTLRFQKFILRHYLFRPKIIFCSFRIKFVLFLRKQPKNVHISDTHFCIVCRKKRKKTSLPSSRVAYLTSASSIIIATYIDLLHTVRQSYCKALAILCRHIFHDTLTHPHCLDWVNMQANRHNILCK